VCDGAELPRDAGGGELMRAPPESMRGLDARPPDMPPPPVRAGLVCCTPALCGVVAVRGAPAIPGRAAVVAPTGAGAIAVVRGTLTVACPLLEKVRFTFDRLV
jgi:hypothetical protein